MSPFKGAPTPHVTPPGVVGRFTLEVVVIQVPGPWLTYAAGKSVICKAQRLDRDGRPRGRCEATILMTGARTALVRIVGTVEVPMPRTIEGFTHRCRCSTIYEIDWEDRREWDRGQPDRRTSVVLT